MNRSFMLPAVLVLTATGCSSALADRQPINCAIGDEPEAFLRHTCTTVRHASEFDGCVASGDIDAHACIVMDADLSFCDAGTDVPITAYFDRPGHTLDCAGGTIDHGVVTTGGGRPAPARAEATTPEARMPGVWFRRDVSVSDAAVRNCTVRRTGHHGVTMQRSFRGQLDGEGRQADGSAPLGHHDIVFQDLVLEDLISGIYLGNYSRDITMERVVVDATQRIAIYSESGSHRLSLRDSVIANNRTREAVAIDSTYDSEIIDTLFVDNRDGGINLYLNCGELKGSVCPVIRDTPSNNNRIVGNRFVGNGTTGVQVASRQGRKHADGWCATLDGQAGRHTDTAQDNTVEDNLFVCHEGTALVVMDGPNRIADNQIVARGACVPLEVSTGGLGRDASEALDGLVLSGNRIDSTRPPRLRNLPAGVSLD